ncbi:hypothetical protein [Streptomyces avermitilis]|uniref:hypothetical protein n=1 Tax=Streptomyces avermitilis TaxID=33903 RepID=UPI0033A5793E
MRPRSGWLLGCVLAPSLLLTACTSDHDSAPESTASPAATHRNTEAQAEQKLTAQAQSALDAVTDQDDSMVESGVERVSDGVHTQPDLARGVSYKLSVVCAGKGDTEIAFTPTSAGSKKSVSCDRSVVFERFVGKDSLRLDIQEKPGVTGVITWRINKV